MPAGSNYRSPSSFTCLPHKGLTIHLLLSRPCSRVATEPHQGANTHPRVWTGVIKLVKFAQLLWAKLIQANGVHGGLPAAPTPQYTTELPTLYLDGRPDRTTGYLKGAS
jgi:hypothetical protein